MIDLIRERLLNHFIIFAVGSAISLVGFTLIGFVHSGALRRRAHKPAGLRELLSDVYPKEMYVGPTARMDLLNFLPTNLLVRPLMDVAQLVIVIALGGELATVFADGLRGAFGNMLQLAPPVYAVVSLQVLLTFFGSEFGVYVFHRWEHENPLLWRIHSVHHSAEKLNYFTAVRDHPLETVAITLSKMLGAAGFLGVVLFLSGVSLHPQTFFYTGLVFICFHGFYAGHSHSHLPISFGPFLDVLIGGPVMHQVHHSAESHMFNKNYGMATNVFDWMFGTLYMPKHGEVYRWGLSEEQLGARNPHQTLDDFYLKPVREMMAMARSGIRNLIQKWI